MMLVRLDGSPRYAMWTQVAGAITNIVLDRLFIWFSSSLKFYCLKMSITSLPLTLRNIGNMAKIGFATFLTEIALLVQLHFKAFLVKLRKARVQYLRSVPDDILGHLSTL